jgi:DNA-binding YbaB/EbfC family protein
MSDQDPTSAFDMGALLSQLGEVQRGLAEAQEAVAAQVLEGTAGGGAVRVTVTGAMEFESVSISPEVVDPGDVDMLADLVLVAVRDAVEKVQSANRQILGGIDPSAGPGGAGPLGALGGLLDGPPDS